jgi:hypothetical protein
VQPNSFANLLKAAPAPAQLDLCRRNSGAYFGCAFDIVNTSLCENQVSTETGQLQGQVEALLEIKPGDLALRAIMAPGPSADRAAHARRRSARACRFGQEDIDWSDLSRRTARILRTGTAAAPPSPSFRVEKRSW